ncbi:sulfotransferase family 2 domain-containing protein [Pseudoalteromonas xiamenensis]|uniref:sulfotransferase family 2 domain-containing protein n=1 Tax=Pseudoalteromonas xiamenensis TaxID=882626 RepID=UPI0027E3EA19|nr:sulfotransferase family 2 domain-containing protein [Pseudoalteromonas xiamenensis]WMN59389.1 sulfotransferase family 2 domain-containing protein [Pseudoalteromonas xiamenensis]
MFQSLVSENSDGLKIYLNHLNAKKDSTPVFFYHVEKSGGITFSNTLGFSLQSKNMHAYRIDIDEELERLKIHAPKLSLISTHSKFGVHSELNLTKLRLVTFLREPFARVLSDYTYTCMRASEKPSLEGFGKHFRQPRLHNLMTKQLCPLEYFEGASTQAFENLKANFFAFGTSAHIDAMLDLLITQFDLPNVLTARLNTTTPKYKLVADEFKEEVLELNSDDAKLFELVTKQPRIPTLELPNEFVVDESTILLHEFEKETKSLTSAKMYPTSAVYEAFSRAKASGVKLSIEMLMGK